MVRGIKCKKTGVKIKTSKKDRSFNAYYKRTGALKVIMVKVVRGILRGEATLVKMVRVVRGI